MMDYGAIGIGIGIAGVIFAGLAWLVANRSLKYRMLTELMSEYSHRVTGKAVEILWDFQKECADNNKQLEDEFERRLKKMKGNKGKKDEEDEQTEKVNYARRQVSHFYQRMAALHEGYVLPDKILYRIWREKDLRIIPEIIIPLDKVLIKLIKEKEKRRKKEEKEPEDNEVFKMLTKLYEHSKGPGITIF